MTEWVGRVVSKVEVQKLLGRGGMAEVYLGTHTTLNRPVAVKVLQAHLSDDAMLLTRFKSEAQAVAAMRHPNIVQVFDFDVMDDQPFMVMELLEGPSLKDYLNTQHANRTAVAPGDIARIIFALGAALDYAHSRGIIHRDIKPANVMLRRESGQIDPSGPLPFDAEPVLTDFGVARIANAAAQTASGTIVGTPAYMSPEQVRGEGIDSRSDIYALGIMLYEMLAGQVPFAGDTQASILLKQINEPPPPLPSDYSALQPILDRALAKDPDARFQKASDMASVLDAALGLPSASSITEPRYREPVVPAASDGPSTARIAPDTAHPDATPVVTMGAPTQVAAPGPSPIWIAAGVGGLALIVAAAALGIVLLGGQGGASPGTPTMQPSGVAQTGAATGAATPAVFAAQKVGRVLIHDASVTVALEGVDAPPEGMAYQVWLTEPDQPALSLGVLGVSGGSGSLSFIAPDGKPLLARYSGVMITLEAAGAPADQPGGEALYAGQLDPERLTQIRLMLSKTTASSFKEAIITGVDRQAGVYDGHINNTIAAITASDLNLSKLHAEHVINIIVGESSSDYADYNNNGRPENPGDGVGLLPYLLILKDSASGAALAPDAPGDAQTLANNIGQKVDEVIPMLGQTQDLEQSVTAADSVDEIRPITTGLDGLRVRDLLAEMLDSAAGLDLSISIDIVTLAP